MRTRKARRLSVAFIASLAACGTPESGSRAAGPETPDFDRVIANHGASLLREGRDTFRYDTFGSEAFWGGQLRLHEAVARVVSPRAALEAGLKVDLDALPADLVGQAKRKVLDLESPATTLRLLALDAVVGVKGHFEADGSLRSIGITCALCHSTVDDAFVPGIGRRLDGWPNRDLDIGKLVALAPNLQPLAGLLKADVAAVKQVLTSWGPGKYDAELDKDGKAFRPDGKTAATLIPPAYGLAGVNLHTYTGFGSVPYWNAYVAVTQMHGSGVFFDERLNSNEDFPVAARSGSWNVRPQVDRVTAKLPGLHLYQLSIPAPTPPAGSFEPQAYARGEKLFAGRARCAACHVPPLYTEPGNALHAPEEIGIDDFQAKRSPTGMYRTTPLRGLWSRTKGGFYHDGRFATLPDVIDHYDRHFRLGLTPSERKDLVQFLLGL